MKNMEIKNQFLITKEEDGFNFINLTTIDYRTDNILKHLKSKITIGSVIFTFLTKFKRFLKG